ncbi:hypothetical protein C7974DRAFT_305413 [Boeremia exigua]|uniref:uncharacterized protein n=1 Tax=Boeremia exigua TaxID=749465 RepID=UPI001E8DD42E|nr:uncharacterized protein C7974DRAFT_305413 [Boeremia exigua]KAH6639148.1 hypothetical protein C7974DRAFT_305413 [Boeremia exigua]
MTTTSPPASPPTSAPSVSEPTEPFPFLALPLELREQIYELYFRPADRLHTSSELENSGFYGGVYKFDLRLLQVGKQVSAEAQRVWRREVRMVKVGTPWPSAVNHISSEGLVPIVCADSRADAFTAHHALIQITAPFHQAGPEHAVILLLADLPLFAQTWHYSALSYPMLNDRLATAFTLRDPDMDHIDEDTPPPTPLALQRAILLPFGCVKGLHALRTTNFAPAVAAELRAAMAVPAPTLHQACDSATALLAAGDAALPADPRAALALYTQAFHAIHIIIAGRTRRVLADPFFHAHITAGPWAGHTGMTVRVILRLRLVARVLSAHLALGAWGEAAFWGMRSVRIMGDAMDSEFEHFLADLVGGEDVGCVFARAGVAMWKMRDEGGWEKELRLYEGEARAGVETLLRGSLKHLRKPGGRERVRAEVERWGLPRELVRIFDEPVRARSDGSEAVNFDPTEHPAVWF